MLKTKILSAVSKARTALSDLAIDCSLVKRSTNVYVPGMTPTHTSSTSPVKLVLTDYEVREIDDDRIKRTDKRAILLEPAVVVAPNDLIIDGSTTYRVVTVNSYMVGDTPAATDIQLRPA